MSQKRHVSYKGQLFNIVLSNKFKKGKECNLLNYSQLNDTQTITYI
jgi:hypothetical protein